MYKKIVIKEDCSAIVFLTENRQWRNCCVFLLRKWECCHIVGHVVTSRKSPIKNLNTPIIAWQLLDSSDWSELIFFYFRTKWIGHTRRAGWQKIYIVQVKKINTFTHMRCFFKLKDYEFKMLVLFLSATLLMAGKRYKRYWMLIKERKKKTQT